MSEDDRLTRLLVSCYPATWRRRYGEEYAQLLRDLRVHRHPVLVVDSLRGAVRAYGGVLVSRRAPVTVVVWAGGLFTVAGIGFAKLAEDFTGEGRSMYRLLVVSAAVALLALAAAAVPTAVAMRPRRDPVAWAYVAVPVVGTAAWYAVLRLVLAMPSGGVHSAANVVGFALVAVSGTAVVAATAWAADRVIRRVPAVQRPQLRAAAILTAAGGMAVAAVAALAWGLQVRSADPSGFRGDHGVLATPFVPSWIVVVVALAAAAGLAGQAARRQIVTR